MFASMLVGFPRFLRRLLIACGLVSFLAGADILVTTWSDRGVPDQTITVCRATDVANRPYQAANVRIAPDGSLPRDVDPMRDVVPPYSYGGTDYPGANWSSQGQAVWYAGCQATGNSLQAAESAPATPAAAPPQSQTRQPILGVWPQAVVVQGAVRVVAAWVMVIGILMIGVAGIGVPPESEPPPVRVSSDLYMSSKPRIRPRRSGQ
jgi:hypothetical protein